MYFEEERINVLSIFGMWVVQIEKGKFILCYPCSGPFLSSLQLKMTTLISCFHLFYPTYHDRLFVLHPKRILLYKILVRARNPTFLLFSCMKNQSPLYQKNLIYMYFFFILRRKYILPNNETMNFTKNQNNFPFSY